MSRYRDIGYCIDTAKGRRILGTLMAYTLLHNKEKETELIKELNQYIKELQNKRKWARTLLQRNKRNKRNKPSNTIIGNM